MRSNQYHLIIDGDMLAYHKAAGIEQKIRWSTDIISKFADPVQARANVDAYIQELLVRFDTDHFTICLTDTETTNFRLAITKSYKGNRKDKERPIMLAHLRAYLKSNDGYAQHIVIRPCCEADDTMGFLMTDPAWTHPRERIQIAEDKDMLQIPGLIFNPRHPSSGPVKVTEFDADRHHMYQTLVGDTVDNYKGCPGIGPKKATKILEGLTTLKEMWIAVVATFQKQVPGTKQEGYELALKQAQVSKICRYEDFLTNGLPRVWQPRFM